MILSGAKFLYLLSHEYSYHLLEIVYWIIKSLTLFI